MLLRKPMKSLFLLVLTICCFSADATNYYVANSGNDSNNGTDPSTPWKTIDKVNSFNSFLPGDNILFKRGDTFYGSISVIQSGVQGSPITYGAYGSGAKPIITGFSTVSSWTNLGSNIWESSSAISVGSQPNMVLINGVNTPMGRTPNTGWNSITSSTATSVSSSGLSSGTWTGAEIITKDERYIITRRTITSQSSSTVNFASDAYNPRNGWGYFIQNSLATLDQQNEWFFNTLTNKIDIYSTSMPTNVQVSSIDILVTISSATHQDYITFDNIDFEGANKNVFILGRSGNIIIQNCSLNFCGDQAILGQNQGDSSNYCSVTNCSFSNNQNDPINLPGEYAHAYIAYNTINNTGLIPGMSGYDNSISNATAINALGPNSTIEYNYIDSVGYMGIRFFGSGVTVNNNLINYYCLTMDDGGGIYTQDYGTPAFTGRIIKNNIILNGMGNDSGIGEGEGLLANGIYMDANTKGVTINNNTVYAAAWAGIFLQGNTNMDVENNTVYATESNGALFTMAGTGVTFKKNIIVTKSSSGLCVGVLGVPGIASAFTLDSNYYCRPLADNQVFVDYSSHLFYNLASWKTYTGQEVHSQKSPKSVTSIDSLRFEYNATSSSTTVPLGAKYIDVKGQSYNGSITLAPYSSAVLIKSGNIVNASPTAHAGTDTSVTLPTNSVSVSGSGSDQDGSIAKYLWTKISGPSSCKITDSTSASTTVNGLIQGIYTFELTVTDDKGATGKDTVQVKVNAADNIAPTANAGKDQTITLPANSVSLSGSGSDSDGSISKYLWRKISGGSAVISDSTSASTTVNGLIQGIYTFELTVTDDKGATGKDTVQVKVNAADNIAPTANAGKDQTITLPANSVSVSGSGSDQDGSIAKYLWTKISGPSSCKITDSTSASTTVNGLIQGIYTFELTVTDDKGATGKDTVQAKVNAADNIAPTANAGKDQTITLPANSVSVSGSGSDQDGSIAKYLWTKISGPSSCKITDSTSASTTVNGLIQGIYTFELTVTDDKGATGKDTVQAKVNAADNIAPTANAGKDQTITLPANSVSVSGSGSDQDGSIAKYLWTKISGPSSCKITDSTSASTTVNGLIQGIYTFELTVTDDKGATGKDTVQVKVNAADNIAPTANAGKDQTITLPENSLQLSGSGSDAHGTIVAFGWTKVSGPSSFSLINSSSAIASVSNLVEGKYKFQLEVTDDKGATGKDTVQIIVNAATSTTTSVNKAPTANAGPDQIITLPVNSLQLSGSGSDVDGTIAGYVWTKIAGPSGFILVNSSSATASISNLVKGTYKFQLEVTDDKGVTGKDTVQIIVNATASTTTSVNQAPVADAGSDITIVAPTDSVTLSGNGSDLDGEIRSYVWTQLSGLSVATIKNPDFSATQVTDLTAGTYEFQLKVTDNQGAVGTDTVNVTVALPRLAPRTTKLNIYPNPVHSVTTLEVTAPQENTNVSIIITDMSGTVVYKKKFVSSSIYVSEQIDMSNLIKGVYVVSVYFDGIEMQSAKVIRL